MGDFDTSTRRGGPPRGYTPPANEPDEGEVDLIVYCTVSVPVTMATPYTDDELADVAGGEIGYSATFVSVDHVDVDVHHLAPAAIAAPRRPGRGFLDRLLHG